MNDTSEKVGSEPNTELATNSTQLRALAKYVSRVLLSRLTQIKGDIAAEKVQYPASVLFADVSGFTKLTESLTDQYGSDQAIGAEHLTFMLSEYFDRLIEVVHAHGGDVIKFAGDALLILFPCEEQTMALQRGSSCGVKMQVVARDIAQEIYRDQGIELSLKVAISYGDIAGMMLGGVFNRWEYAVISEAIVEVGRIGDMAHSHDVLISKKNFSILAAEGKSGLQGETKTDNIVNILAVPGWDLQYIPEDNPIELDAALGSKICSFIPAAVVSRIMAGQTDSRLLGELRRISVLFINLPHFAADISVGGAQQLVSTIQEACYTQRGSIDKLSCDDKGVSVIAGFGIPPMSAEDDPVRAVKAALTIISLLDKLGLTASIGVASGPVYCGTLGIRYRQEYTMMGDGVNTAARLMQKAENNILCDETTMQACSADIVFDAGTAFTLKGKSQPVRAFQPLSLKEAEQHEDTNIVGRQVERKTLGDELDFLAPGKAARIVIVEGEAGIGKTALVQAFCQDLPASLSSYCYRCSANTVKIAFYGVWRSLLYQCLSLEELDKSEDIESALRAMLEEHDLSTLTDLLCLLNNILGLGFEETSLTQQMHSEVRAENTHRLIHGMLAKVSEKQSLIFIIDDAHWMDSASWQLLSSLQYQLSNCLFVIMLRPFPQEAPPSYKQIRSQDSNEYIGLGRFSVQEIADLVAQSLRVRKLPDTIAALIMQHAEGHPLFSELLTKDLIERDILRVVEGECCFTPGISSSMDIEMPSSIEGAITSQLERLTLRQQLALKTASVIGRSFTVEELEFIYPVQQERGELPDELESLSEQGVTQELKPRFAYQFKQVAALRIAYDLMLYSQRKKLHEQMANWLERKPPAELGQHHASLAHHWRQAENFEKAIYYLGQAALQAEAVFANNEVISFIDKLLQLVDEKQLDITPLSYARWLSMLGQSYMNLGKYQDAEVCWRRALLKLGLRLPKSDIALVWRGLGAIVSQITLRHAPGLLPKVSEARREDFATISEILERLFMAYFFMESTPGMLYTSFAAANHGERTGKQSAVLARCYSSLAGALAVVPLPALADYYARRGSEVAEAVKDAPALSWVYLINGTYQIGLGRWHSVEENFNKAMVLAERLGDQRRWEEAAAAHCLAGFLGGRIQPMTQSGHLYQLIYESGLSRGVVQIQAWGLCVWSFALIFRGCLGEARPLVLQLQELMSSSPKDFDLINQVEVISASALVALHEDDIEKAASWVERGVDLVKLWRRPSSFRVLMCSYFLCEASIRLYGRSKGAGGNEHLQWVRTLLRNMDRCVGVFPVIKSRELLLKGWLARLMDNAALALKHWSKSMALAIDSDMKYDIALLNLALSDLELTSPTTLVLKSSDELQILLQELTIEQSDYHRDWGRHIAR